MEAPKAALLVLCTTHSAQTCLLCFRDMLTACHVSTVQWCSLLCSVHTSHHPAVAVQCPHRPSSSSCDRSFACVCVLQVYFKYMRREIAVPGQDLCDMSGAKDRKPDEFTVYNVMLPRIYYPAWQGNVLESRCKVSTCSRCWPQCTFAVDRSNVYCSLYIVFQPSAELPCDQHHARSVILL